jgi:hypothetical protein
MSAFQARKRRFVRPAWGTHEFTAHESWIPVNHVSHVASLAQELYNSFSGPRHLRDPDTEQS